MKASSVLDSGCPSPPGSTLSERLNVGQLVGSSKSIQDALKKSALQVDPPTASVPSE